MLLVGVGRKLLGSGQMVLMTICKKKNCATGRASMDM